MTWTALGLGTGLALGFAAAFGGFTAFAIVALFGVVGLGIGRWLDGQVDLAELVDAARGRER